MDLGLSNGTGKREKDLSIKACSRQHIYCCSPESLADTKDTNSQTEQMKDLLLYGKAQGLGSQIFHTRPSPSFLPPPLCPVLSSPWV